MIDIILKQLEVLWDLFLQGLAFMGIGMGFVILFLVIMIFSMIGMSKAIAAINKIFPEDIKIVEKPGKRANVSEEEAIAVAIAVAKSRG